MSGFSQKTAPVENPFADPMADPFSDPQNSYRVELKRFSSLPHESYGAKRHSVRGMRRKFISYRLKGDYYQQWTNHPRLNRTKLNNRIVAFFMGLGVVLSGVICFWRTTTVNKLPYCLILDDNFETLDNNIWNYAVQIDGFGTGSFDWTTTDPRNSYVDKDGLHIVPTLTNETTDINNDMLYNGYTLNLNDTTDGACTGNTAAACSVTSNSETGAMIPPVRSARLTTQGKKTIKYGRVEVTAKLPTGDWLWPAIWMMPEDSVYGVWPRSGEIDIMESRGNNYTYSLGGNDVQASTLHWGPSSDTDGYWRTTAGKALRRTNYAESFHTFGIEWTEDYIFSYVDSRLTEVLFVDFAKFKGFWNRGKFENEGSSSEFLMNPWAQTTSKAAPFDQNFYLILNVAVGARNGWFADKSDGKPWLDASTNAQWDFYSSSGDWLPTWGKGDAKGMTVRSVKMWQQGKCR